MKTDQEIQMEKDRKVTRKTLMPHARRIAQETMNRIHLTVPTTIPTMPYARQWVLEEAIKLLQEQV
jgi:hypothetical protein